MILLNNNTVGSRDNSGEQTKTQNKYLKESSN